MLKARYLLKILFLYSCICFSAFADNSLNVFSFHNNDLENQVNSSYTFNKKRFITNRAKITDVKFGIVFTPEDLMTEPYKNYLPKRDETQLVIAENSNRIIGFYIQSYF